MPLHRVNGQGLTPEVSPMPQKITMSPGSRYGRLTVLEEDPERTAKGAVRWICRCDCSTAISVTGRLLREGIEPSCGCVRRETLAERNTRSAKYHGMSRSPEYAIWSSMFRRCRDPHVESYAKYGGRGIDVVAEWANFDRFYADMGPRPSLRHSLDRIDNDGPYAPWNCRWATAIEQMRNTRQNVYLTYQGKRLTLRGWAEETGLSPTTIRYRLVTGWSIERILSTPARSYRSA